MFFFPSCSIGIVAELFSLNSYFIAKALTKFNILCVGLFKIRIFSLVLKAEKMSDSDNYLDKTMNLQSDEYCTIQVLISLLLDLNIGPPIGKVLGLLEEILFS